MKILMEASYFIRSSRGVYFNLMETNKEILEEKFRETLNKAIIDAGNPKEIGAVVVFNCILKHLANETCFIMTLMEYGRN